MSDFNVRATITEIMDNSDVSDPRLIAKEVVAKIPAKLLRGVCELVMTEYVRVHFTRNRMGMLAPRPGTFSSKVAAIRDAAPAWKKALRDRWRAPDGFKMLGDFNYDDLLFAAMQRRQLAQLNEASAIRAEHYAAKVKQYDVKCVRDLPESVLASLFSVATP